SGCRQTTLGATCTTTACASSCTVTRSTTAGSRPAPRNETGKSSATSKHSPANGPTDSATATQTPARQPSPSGSTTTTTNETTAHSATGHPTADSFETTRGTTPSREVRTQSSSNRRVGRLISHPRGHEQENASLAQARAWYPTGRSSPAAPSL